MTDLCFADYFVTRTRGDNHETKYVTTTDDAPQWMKDAVRVAHRGTLPNDWVYAECRAAASAFDEGDLTDAEDTLHTHADARIDVHTQGLYQWASDLCLTSLFTHAEGEAAGVEMDDASIAKSLGYVQYAAVIHIAETIRAACVAARGGT